MISLYITCEKIDYIMKWFDDGVLKLRQMVNKVNFKRHSQLIIKETSSSTVQHNVWTFELKWRTSEMFLFSSYLHWKRSVKVSHHSFESTCFVTSVDVQIIFSRISEIEVSLLCIILAPCSPLHYRFVLNK